MLKAGMIPTPRAGMGRKGWGIGGKKRYSEKVEKNALKLSGGAWIPLVATVEWIMGWPIGWTDLKPLAMDKFQEWSDLHGKF